MSLLDKVLNIVINGGLDLIQYHLGGLFLLLLAVILILPVKKKNISRHGRIYLNVLLSSIVLWFAVLDLSLIIPQPFAVGHRFDNGIADYVQSVLLWSLPCIWAGIFYSRRSWHIGLPLVTVQGLSFFYTLGGFHINDVNNTFRPYIFKSIFFHSVIFISVNFIVAFGVRLYLKRKDSRILDKKVLISSENDEAVRKGL